MPILDPQVEAYERNHPGRPWVGILYGPHQRHWLGLVPRWVIWRMWASNIMQSRHSSASGNLRRCRERWALGARFRGVRLVDTIGSPADLSGTV